MNIKNEDANFHVEGLKKEGISGSYRLNWEKRGIDHFIVVSNPVKEKVILNKNQELNLLFDNIADRIINDFSITLNDTTFFYISFPELRKNGGLEIKEKPGYYAVYGCDVENNCLKAIYFTPGTENIISISVDVKINQENFYIEIKKGFLGIGKKESIYSGYKKITVPKGINGISEYSIKYFANKGKYIYSFPKYVLENGGSFFIKANENEDIQFKSNNLGIRII